jgi:hypothetical protein
MEYRRAYWEEQIDNDMVRRHETQIFPLMRRRRLFSGAEYFALFDFITPDGFTDENVFAYSNRSGDERAIVLYNNAYNTTRGTILTSTAINVGEGNQISLVHRTLGEALALNPSWDCFYIFRDYQSGLEFIRSGHQLTEQGLHAELHAYQYHVFMDFHEIQDTDGTWKSFERHLAGSGVPSIAEARREFQLGPIAGLYRDVMNLSVIRGTIKGDSEVRIKSRAAIAHFIAGINREAGTFLAIAPLVEQFASGHEELCKMTAALGTGEPASMALDSTRKLPRVGPDELRHIAFAWLTLNGLAARRYAQGETTPVFISGFQIDQWLIQKVVRNVFEELTGDSVAAHWDSVLVQILAYHTQLLAGPPEKLGTSFRWALTDTSVREYLEFNRHNDVLWLSKERLGRLIDAMILVSRLDGNTGAASDDLRDSRINNNASVILSAASRSGYQAENMVKILSPDASELIL